MTGTVTAPKYTTWTAPGFPFRIESAGDVLDQIRLAAVEGYHRVPHGGVETGGILYGTHLKNVVRIKSWRPIECEYSKGPSFLLSEKEEAALAETLKAGRDDPELARLEPVGWCRAHTRSEILLSDVDQAFFDRFFPQPWQVALIVRPASFAPTRAGYFFREPGGHIRTQSSYREFTLTPVAVRRASAPVEPPPVSEPEAPVPEPPPAVVEAAAPEVPPPTPPQPAPPLPQPPPRHEIKAEPYRPPPRTRKPMRRQFWYGIGALAVAILGFTLLRSTHPSLALTAADLRGQLRISWDRNGRPVNHASGGEIEIDDHGARTQVSLTPADLRSGSVFYERQSGDVSVRLTVNIPGSPPIAETVHFLRPGEAPQVPMQRPDAAHKAETPVPPASRPMPARVEPPPSPAATRPTTLPPPVPVTTERPAIPFHAPQPAPRKPSTEIQAIAPPSIDGLPAAPPGGLSSVLGPAQHAAPAPAPAAPARPAATASTGRIIWTGKLGKNGRLIIAGNHASSGSIVGALPASVAHVSAYPGDLTSAGITLFTADPRYSQPVTEKAGADNGWNSTTYTLDSKRASGIRIAEQPSAQNGFKLVLQCEISKVSVLMLEWRAP